MANYDNTAREKRINLFNQKIDYFVQHSKYEWLRKYSDEALHWDTCAGFYQIKAADFIDRIINASIDYIRDWLDGKNNLEWAGINKEN